jgi:hypothetical protein
MKTSNFTIKNFIDGSDIIIEKNVTLTNDQLLSLKYSAFNNVNLSKLSAKQKKQLIAYAITEAEKYHSTHSMRYTIMKDVCLALFNLNEIKLTSVYIALENDIYNVYNSKGCTVPLATFTEYTDLEQYCKDNNFKFTTIDGLD